MGYDILIEETRAGLVENKHFGIICGINEMKKQIYQVGDSQQEVFFDLQQNRFKPYHYF